MNPEMKSEFYWRLIKAPQFVINYVVIDELAHLIELTTMNASGIL